MANAQMQSSPSDASKEAVAAAFGLSAAITAIFNVLLAFIKDSWPALNSFMAHLTGHHWRTHGLADVIVFFALGWFFMSRGSPNKLTTNSSVVLAACVIVASAALGLWFLVV